MDYLDVLQKLAESGVLRKPAPEAVPYFLAKPDGGDNSVPQGAASVPGDSAPPPAPTPEPPVVPSLAPTTFPVGLRDEDLAQAQRSDTASRLALGGANAMLAGAGVQGGGFKPSDYAGDIIQRRKAVQGGQELDEKGLEIAGKRAAMGIQMAQQKALLDPAVIESQRRQIAWDVASSQKGGGIPTPDEIDRSYAVVSRWQPAALPTLAESAIKRNKERATANKDYEEAYRANQAGQKEAAEAQELPANAKSERALKYATAQMHNAQAQYYLEGKGRDRADKDAAKEDAADQKQAQLFDKSLDPNGGRAGEMGKRQNRVNNADAVMALGLDENGKPRDLPSFQMTELAIGVANLISASGVASESTIKNLTAETARGNYAKAAQYFTNRPVGAGQQDFVNLLMETAKRERATAQKAVTAAALERTAAFKDWITKHPDHAKQILSGRGHDPGIVDDIISGRAVHGNAGAPPAAVSAPPGDKYLAPAPAEPTKAPATVTAEIPKYTRDPKSGKLVRVTP